MSNVQIDSSDLQFNVPESALGYHNFFKSSKISALLEVSVTGYSSEFPIRQMKERSYEPKGN